VLHSNRPLLRDHQKSVKNGNHIHWNNPRQRWSETLAIL
jgi:hypothetical protein